jgi:hypothetical protein
MDLLATLKADYERFPASPTYSLYVEDVYFKDPMTSFRGIQQYQKMILFMTRWFEEMRLELHQLERQGDRIESRWTLYWTTPLPWRPRIEISGSSELLLNPEGLIVSHIDTWDCSRLDVLKQHWRSGVS